MLVMNKPAQILMLSANAKVPLLRAFQRAGAVAHAADLSPERAAMVLADHQIVLPRSGHRAFAAALIDYCSSQSIDLVVPTRDGDLRPLADLADRLRARGTECLVPSVATIETCSDKRAFAQYCLDHGFPVPRLYTPGQKGPFFVRPRFAAGGSDGLRVDNDRDPAFRHDEDFLAQTLVEAPEYSVDIVSDFSGQAWQAVARRRVLVAGGEAQISVVEEQAELVALALKLAQALGLAGHSVIQVFLHPEHGPLLIEVNPRFGGASTLSIEAGLASPERLLSHLRGDEQAANPRDIKYGLTLLRYASDIYLMADEIAGRDR